VITIHHGDCLEVMRTMPDNSVDSVVTDPPYHLTAGKRGGAGAASEHAEGSPFARVSRLNSGGFMGKSWDGGDIAQQPEVWAEALRVLKPGGYLLAFGGTRTYHRMVCAIEDGGFEIRDQIGWAFGSGFPKSHNGEWGGTALKPAWEPICMARKPLIGTVEQNWCEHGTGALNIDGCRIPTSEDLRAGAGGIPCRHDETMPRGRTGEPSANSRYASEGGTDFAMKPGPRGGSETGRWPANLIHDGSDEVVALFPRDAGAAAPVTVRNGDKFRTAYGAFKGNRDESGSTFQRDSGSAARFFYVPKTDRADRNDGCEHMERKPLNWCSGTQSPGTFQAEGTDRSSPNHHPTVKPTDLMRYLCRLVTPAGGVVLDAFMGSGSTGRGAVLEGFRFIGIEREAEYVEIARARIDSARRQGHQPSLDLAA